MGNTDRSIFKNFKWAVFQSSDILASHFNIQINMLKNGVLVGFGPSDPKENLILSLEVEHVKSNFKSDSALHCRAISKKQ